MADTYLRSSRIIVGRHDYFAEEEANTVKVNGIEMSIDEFRALRPIEKRKMGMVQKEKIETTVKGG